MAGDDIDDDDYVASLLTQDAKLSAKKYEMVGLDAFNPSRSRPGVPKPNTRFLRHIIRETDTHNAALLAREAEESRARLKRMEMETSRERGKTARRRDPGRLTPPDITDEDSRKKRKTSFHEDDRTGRQPKQKRHRSRDRHSDDRSRRTREDETGRHRAREHDNRSDEEHNRRRFRHLKSRRSKDKRYHDASEDEDKERSARGKSNRKGKRRRSPSATRSRSRSPHNTDRRISKHRRHELNSAEAPPSSRGRRQNSSEGVKGRRRLQQLSPARQSDSDPLESIIGPLPAQSQPAVRSRGRGAHKANSTAMDARFSSAYNPQSDVRLNSDAEDDWGDALEALQDRQKWKQQGAERLKAAGFSDEQVNKWERGEERNEEDVVWSIKGEREWDRGKVIGEEGDVALKAEWGRLK